MRGACDLSPGGLVAFQSQFLRFHETIKLDNFDENAILRDKRDIILQKLRDRCPYRFTYFNQGSYAMNTGVTPLDRDFDLDVGVVFKINPREISPETVKKIVFDAVSDHTGRVEWRNACITVFYQKAGDTIFHVDLPVYVEDAGGQLHLALGKQHSAREAKVWQTGDPRFFIQAMRDKFTGEDARQMRRIIRYLKRWRDVHFPSHGSAAPVGIGLTLAAYHWFQPMRSWDARGAGDYSDLGALLALVRHMCGQFSWGGRLGLQMPVAPHDDVFRRMTDQQMAEFRQRLMHLADWLSQAVVNNNSNLLVRAFGEDFVV